MTKIYLIEAQDLLNNFISYKIGYSKHPEKRIKQLQTGTDKKLSIKFLCETKYPSKIETMLKKTYKEKNILGEHFNLDENDINNFLYYCELYNKNLNIINDNEI